MSLQENLKNKKFIVTSEIQPPIGTGVQDLIRNVDRIRGRVDALTVPELKIEGLVTDRRTKNSIRSFRPPAVRRIGLKFRNISYEHQNLVWRIF